MSDQTSCEDCNLTGPLVGGRCAACANGMQRYQQLRRCEAMNARDVTPAGLASAVGLHPTHIQKFMDGRWKPAPLVARRIERALGIAPGGLDEDLRALPTHNPKDADA